MTSPPDLAILDIQDAAHGWHRAFTAPAAEFRHAGYPPDFKGGGIDELPALKIGADDFIRKPFSQRVLLERVRVILRRATLKDNYKDDYSTGALPLKVLVHTLLSAEASNLPMLRATR